MRLGKNIPPPAKTFDTPKDTLKETTKILQKNGFCNCEPLKSALVLPPSLPPPYPEYICCCGCHLFEMKRVWSTKSTSKISASQI
jgi:hypothetical protein